MTSLQNSIPQIAKAFAPLVQRFSYPPSDPVQTSQEVTIEKQRSLYSENYDLIATLKAEYFDRKATFRYEPIIRSLFKDEVDTFPEDDLPIDGLFTDYNLVAYVRLPHFIAQGRLMYQAYTMLNAAAQMGEDIEVAPAAFLTSFHRIKRYDGFPLSVSFVTDKGAYPHIDGETIYDSSYNDPWKHIERGHHITIADLQANHGIAITNTESDPYLRDVHGEIVTDNLGDPILVDNPPFIYDRITILKGAAPKHPFYVRWINAQGGYDHWMFACRQIFKRELTGVSYFKPYSDSLTNGIDSLPISKEAEETITASTGIINTNEWGAISRILYSPKIERYNPDTQQWQTIRLDKGSAEISTEAPTGEITLSFILPTPRLQF